MEFQSCNAAMPEGMSVVNANQVPVGLMHCMLRSEVSRPMVSILLNCDFAKLCSSLPVVASKTVTKGSLDLRGLRSNATNCFSSGLNCNCRARTGGVVTRLSVPNSKIVIPKGTPELL